VQIFFFFFFFFFFTHAERKPVFYVASRGHHADIGGISPGSMPPNSAYLEEEGAAILSFFLVKNGVFDEAGISEILSFPGAQENKYSKIKSSGTRDLKNNLSDLKAQVAANTKGIQLMQQLISEYGLSVICAYMQHVQDNCESAVRNLLRQVARDRNLSFGQQLTDVDYMDCGSRICLSVSIDPASGSAVFDFSGTGEQVHGNCNAPRSITFSAIIYSLRCLVNADIPLNQGVMAGISVIIPSPSILSPSPEAAVVSTQICHLFEFF
jgi:5-oxoprolinase (ATP-hydrolysing)